MITEKARLLTRIQTCLNLDKKDPQSLRVQIDKIIHYLHEFKIAVPPRQFEDAVKLFLSKNVIGKAQLGHPGTFPAIANAIVTMASNVMERAIPDEIFNSTEDPLNKEVERYLENKRQENERKHRES